MVENKCREVGEPERIGADFWVPPPPLFQDDVNKERKAATNAASVRTWLPIHLPVVFRLKSDQRMIKSAAERGGGLLGLMQV